MIKKSRAATIGLLLALCACSQQDQASALNPGAPGTQGLAALSASPVSGSRSFDAIANSPDRGALINYDRRTVPLKQGAYTSHRVEVSEEHAIRAIVTGKLSIPAPGGEYLQLNYERHAENSNGNWTWVGRLAGGDRAQEAIITFGEKAVFGSIPQSGGRPDLSLTTRAGKLWVVETDPRLAPGIDRRKQDTLVPVAAAGRQFAAAASSGTQVASGSTASATTSSSSTVDVLLGYTTGFAAKFGGQSQAVTRLTHLVAINNQAYSNSQISGTVRLVGTQQVDYTDGGTNRSALIDLTGSDGSRATAVPASLQPLRAARDTLGADLVALVRAYEYVNEGCGIAWLLGAGQQEIVPSEDAPFAYSIVSNLPDGTSVKGTDGKNYFCSNETVAHELGHLMGSAHDFENAKNDDGSVRYGRYAYSFGAKTDPTAGNFYTVMSYGDDDQKSYRVFSNPSVTLCGGLACGVVNTSENARSLNQTIPVVAGFRASLVPTASAPARNDVNFDASSDLIWFKQGLVDIWLMSGYSIAGTQAYSPASNLYPYLTGELSGVGGIDLVWRDNNGKLIYWIGGSTYSRSSQEHAMSFGWRLQAVGDRNNDGFADLYFRSATDGRLMYWHMGAGQQRLSYKAFALAPEFELISTGDFNGDGSIDLLFRRRADGATQLWSSTGDDFTITTLGSISKYWRPVNSTDHDGDGDDDLVWRSDIDHRVLIWIMEGGVRVDYEVFESDSTRQLLTSGDLNGDGLGDLVWRRNDGAVSVWLNSGTGYVNRYVGTKDTTWQLVRGGI